MNTPTPQPLTHVRREGSGDGTLVLLHGRGTDEHDLLPILDFLDPQQRRLGITVGAPYLAGPGQKHWYIVERVGFPEPVTFAHSYGELQRLLDDELGLDWSRTVVGGFSQGTAMAYALGLGAGRPRPQGILALSGFIPTTDPWTPDLESRRGLPVCIAHGSADPVISVDFARAALAQLEAAGLAVDYHESPMAHRIDPRMLPLLQKWLADLG